MDTSDDSYDLDNPPHPHSPGWWGLVVNGEPKLRADPFYFAFKGIPSPAHFGQHFFGPGVREVAVVPLSVETVGEPVAVPFKKQRP